jgi:hypothetical protein
MSNYAYCQLEVDYPVDSPTDVVRAFNEFVTRAGIVDDPEAPEKFLYATWRAAGGVELDSDGYRDAWGCTSDCENLRRVQAFPAIYRFTVSGRPPLEWMQMVAAGWTGLRFLLKWDIPSACQMGVARVCGKKFTSEMINYY